jgi:DNA polymerase-1
MKILAIDGNSLLNRAFFGVMPLNAPDGTPTNAVYGFINIMNKLRDEHAPDVFCVAQDMRPPTFRHKIYENYKAGRRPMPDELAAQLPLYSEYLDLCGIPRYALEGYEADDLLGAIGRQYGEQGHKCFIVTGDRDAFQLVSANVNVLHVSTRMGRTETMLYDEAAVFEKYGIKPEQLIDMKALMGDASDNIPGVIGVGEKTAGDLMRRFGSLDAIYENLGNVTASLQTKLSNGREEAYMSRELARIDVNAPIELAEPGEPRDLTEFYKRLGFKKFLTNAETQSQPVQMSLF